MTILRIALPTPLRRLFDYLPPDNIDFTQLIPGVRVQVPFGARTMTGVLIDVSKKSTIAPEKLKQALAVLDDAPIFSKDIFELCEWAASYYHHPLGEVLMAAVPVLLRQGKPLVTKKKLPAATEVVTSPLLLNAEQQSALTKICEHTSAFNVYLLDGVTGSGKTEVYLRAIANILAAGKQCLVLVPEISLTPQTIARFRERFNVPIAALHSHLSDGERLAIWLQARAGEVKIVIGTRSAIFTPFANLGLIIVDEEHDQSFKQQDRFRYHARDLAVMRANKNNIPIVLGSATPSLESLLNAKRGRYHYLQLAIRAGGASLPEFAIIDIRQAKLQEGLSQTLLQAMAVQLKLGYQVMLFLNRRGFAPVLFCHQCSWIAECKRCDARLVYHRAPPELRCHHCDARMMIPKKCGACDNQQLEAVGLGTQRVEEILQQVFPDIPVIRVDRDSTRKKEALPELLAQIHENKPAILLGTQMLAKGHHFPQVTLVGMLDADNGLYSADFRAAEQMGQLLLQVAGRAGRAENKGVVMIQTRCPDHLYLQTLINEGYAAFAELLMREREQFILPPYSYYAVFRAEAYSEKMAAKFLENIRHLDVPQAISMLGPIPDVIFKKKGMYGQHLIIRAEKRAGLQAAIAAILTKLEEVKESRAVKWVLDVDPI